MKYDEIILRDLINIYERRDANSSNFKKNIKIKLTKEKYPKYFEDISGYDEAINYLLNKNYIKIRKISHDTVIDSIILNLDKVEEIKELLNINSVSIKRERLLNELNKYDDKIIVDLLNDINYKINNNKSIKQYLNNDFIDSIKAIHYLENLDHVIYERNASNYIYNDSKRLNTLKKLITSIYDNENIFEEKGIINTTPYLYVKGEGSIIINRQEINLSMLNTSIAIPIDNIDIISFSNINKIVTIENLTTFYNYKGDGLIVYLGGFPTKSQIELLKKLKLFCNKFYHFGDIDYGGFMILNYLIENLNINIEAINMDLDTLLANIKYAQIINDDKYILKLKSLLNIDNLRNYYDVINYMIDNKIWLEQESLYNKE